jgi:DNA-binding FadR family transcriptional regulator
LKSQTAARPEAVEVRPARTEERVHRIRVPKTSEIVADHIRGQIVRGDLAEGDYLPPEGQLMTSFGVSRPTLREAFRILEAESLISIVRGSRSGARVHRPRVELVSRYAGYVLQAEATSVCDLYEARLAIEPHIVRRLAAKAPAEAIDRLTAEVERLSGLVRDEQFSDFVVGTAHFHRLLVEAGGNNTLTFLNQLLLDLVVRHQLDHFRRRPVKREAVVRRFQAALRSYQKLIALIAAKDPEGAAAHWQLHLTGANAAWAGAGEAHRVVDSLGEG